MLEPPGQTDEGVLGQVLGGIPVPGEQVGETHRSGGVPDVEFFQPRGLGLGFLDQVDARVHHSQY
ncbi:MAG TPA: hypothetical protein VE915_01770 [Actinomycetota bacterium]|nr:hypothetical protein [Actinomycetota bacterium]